MGTVRSNPVPPPRTAPTPGGRLGALIGGAARFAASFLTPPWCRHCGESLLGCGRPYLCARCLKSVRWITGGVCRTCGFPMGPHAESRDSCRRCAGVDLPLTAGVAVARYAAAARSLVAGLKFRGEAELAVPMAGLMAERFRRVGLPRCDLVLPAPLHAGRRRRRGFDQAALLAGAVAAELGVETADGVIRKIRSTRPQSTLRRRERLQNPRGAYRVDAGLAGLKILLVDDVITTGATIGECAKACRAAGAARVYALSFAR